MGALRRSHGAAALALATLLLLLLARLPPSQRPRAPPPQVRSLPLSVATATAPRSSQATAAPAAVTTVSNTPAAAAVAVAAVARPAPPPANNNSTAAKAPVAPPGEHAPLARELYSAGHERPHPEICPALGAKVRLLVLIASAPSHASARDAVRLTWGHYASRADVALAFVLGQAPAALRPALDAEDALYGDLIVGRFVDSYSNLTLKTLSLLEWADTYCPRAPHVLKTDDDMFINVPRLLAFAAARAKVRGTIWGKLMHKSRPKRTKKSKYFVPPAQFPGAVFPDFTTGPAYLMTSDCCAKLLSAALKERYVRLEDVFVTGVVAQRAGLSRVHAPEFYNKRVAPHPCAVQRGLAIHMVRYHEQFDLWRKLLDGKTKCAG